MQGVVTRTTTVLKTVATNASQDATSYKASLLKNVTGTKAVAVSLRRAWGASADSMLNILSGLIGSGSSVLKLLEMYLSSSPGTEEAEFVSRYFGDNLQFVEFVNNPCILFVDTAYYYAMMASAIYNSWAEKFFDDEWTKNIPGSTKWLQPLAVAQYSLVNRPRFGYYIDWYRKSLLLMVRGTSDVMIDGATDARIDYENLQDFDLRVNGTVDPIAMKLEIVPSDKSESEYLVHAGFINSARNILNHSTHPFTAMYDAAIKAFGDKPPIYVTGHSLGASTSACIVFMLRKNGFDARGVLFAPAPCFSQQLIMDNPDECKNNIVTFINRFDIVTRGEAGVISRSQILNTAALTNDLSNIKKMAVMKEEDEQFRKEAMLQFSAKFDKLSAEEKNIISMEKEIDLSMLDQAERNVTKGRDSWIQQRFLRSRMIKLVCPGQSYWLHYYNAEDRSDGSKGKSTVGLYKILHNDFFDFLPLVYGRTDSTNRSGIANPLSDHSMSNYCAHLYYIRNMLKKCCDPTPEAKQSSPPLDLPAIPEEPAKVPTIKEIVVPEVTEEEKKPTTKARYILPPQVQLRPRKSTATSYLRQFDDLATIERKVLPKPVIVKPKEQSAWEKEYNAWKKTAALGMNALERRSESMHPGLAKKRDEENKKRIDAMIERSKKN